MLKLVSSYNEVSLEYVNNKYRSSKVIFIITDMSDMSNLKGRVYAISTSNSSFEELCEES